MTIVYLTVNKVNYKIYVGVHDCDSAEYDYYLGGGCFANSPSSYMNKTEPIAMAIAKYGPNNFQRTTLKTFESREDALALESIIVDEAFVKNPNTYNIALGGGDPPSNEVTFYQYDLTGKFVKEWVNMKKACMTLNISHDRILSAIKMKKSCADSFWSYEKVDLLDLSKYMFTNRGYIYVYTKNKELVATYPSIRAVSKELDISEETVSNALFRRSCSCGYYFLRGHENIDEVVSGTIQEVLLFYCYNKSGNLMKTYNDVSVALKELENATRSGLKRAIYKEKSYKEYYWSLERYENFFRKEEPKQIDQYDLEGNFIKT